MKTPLTKPERAAGIILIGLLLGAMVTGSISLYHNKKKESQGISIEDAMYVTDWEITKIYSPGTPQQAKIVSQLQSMRDSKIFFDCPILYRMNGSSIENAGEGVLLSPFDPKYPEMALYLKAYKE